MKNITAMLYDELEKVCVPTRRRANVSDDRIRSICFGKVFVPFTKKIPRESSFNSQFPVIWALIQELGDLLYPHQFTWSSSIIMFAVTNTLTLATLVPP